MNYRRSDSEGEAGRLFDELTLRFNRQSVFMDVSAIEPGRDFRKAIDQSVATCSVLLAVIGLEWLNSKDASGALRLNDPNDFVRIELASALQRDIPVIPVLVRGAKMPGSDRLPEDLKELAYRNAVELTHSRWKSDVQVLIQSLRPYLDEPDPNASVTNVNEARRSGALGEEPVRRPEDAPESAAGVATPAITAQTMDRIARELAVYIGPISDLVVRRAAKRCSSAEDLYATVAREIETEQGRLKFLATCRRSTDSRI